MGPESRREGDRMGPGRETLLGAKKGSREGDRGAQRGAGRETGWAHGGRRWGPEREQRGRQDEAQRWNESETVGPREVAGWKTGWRPVREQGRRRWVPERGMKGDRMGQGRETVGPREGAGWLEPFFVLGEGVDCKKNVQGEGGL